MFNRLLESVNGLSLGLYSLFGRDVSPLRPGERARNSYNPLVMTADETLASSPKSSTLTSMSRAERVRKFDEMDETDLASSVVDLQTEDALMAGSQNKAMISVKGNPDTVQTVRQLFDRLGMDEDLYSYARAAVLYGGYITRLLYSADEGVTGIVHTNPENVEMVIDKNTEDLLGYKEKGRLFRDSKSETSFPYDYWHLKIPGKRRNRFYGQSILEAAIRPWCQLCIAEDMALLYRIQRQPDRWVYKIDVGSAPEAEAMRQVQEMKRRTKRSSVIDPVAIRMRAQYNPIGTLEDIYLGTRPDSNTDVSVMQGSGNINDVTDLRYYINKFLAATRTPQAVMGMDDPLNQFQRNRRLTNQDVRYARHIAALQRAICGGLTMLAKVHLAILRSKMTRVVNPEDPEALRLLSWEADENGDPGLDISLPEPSAIAEMERMELMQMRGQLATEIKNLMVNDQGVDQYQWNAFILRDLLQLDEDQIANVLIDPKILQQQQEELAAAEARGKPVREAIVEPLASHADVRRVVSAAGLATDKRVRLYRLLEARPVLMQRLMRVRGLRSDAAAEALNDGNS